MVGLPSAVVFSGPAAFHFPRYFSFFFGRIYLLLRCALIVLTPLQKCIRLPFLSSLRSVFQVQILYFYVQMYIYIFLWTVLYFRAPISERRRRESGIDSGYKE